MGGRVFEGKGKTMTAVNAEISLPVPRSEGQPVDPLFRRIAQPQAYGWCPECNSIIYTRRHRLCGVCGAELPGELLFTAVEASRVKELLKTEQHRHRVWMARRQTV
jgi:hypothetical protein